MADSAVTTELKRIGNAGAAKLKANMAAFNAEVREYAKNKVPQELLVFQKRVVLQVLTGVVLKTPVDTGRARGNWQTTIGSPAEGVVDGTDKGGGTVIAQGVGQLAGLPAFSMVWITNNLPYIISLEGGWSGQAPVGMVAVTLAEMQTMFR